MDLVQTPLFVLCACGCGTPLPPVNKLGKPSRYAHGHNARGRVVSEETRKKIARNTTAQMRRQFGPPKRAQDRHANNVDYKNWRKAVFERDAFTCQRCGKTLHHCFLHAHHVKSWADFPALRYVVDNGLTVCVPCHNAIHGWTVGVEPQPCACGCGELCDPRFKFRHGHWTRVRKGVLTRKGKLNSPEARDKISKALKGRSFSAERKARISAAKKGRSVTGHKNSPETKARMSAARKLWYEHPENRQKTADAVHAAWVERQAALPPVFCACGCGERLPPRKPRSKQARYLRGHRHKGKSPSPEARARMSEAAKHRWAQKALA